MNRTAAVDFLACVQGVWPDRWTQPRTEQWIEVVETCDERNAETALIALRSSHEKCPSIAEFLTVARPAHAPRRDGHSLSCICAGSGWILVTQTNGTRTWDAFDRCPHGPPTSFIEPSDNYDEVAGAAAFATFNALAATAKTRGDLANACFAAAAAYANAERTQLL